MFALRNSLGISVFGLSFGLLLLTIWPVRAQDTNEYGGYNIAGIPGVVERAYGTARDWRVRSASVRGKFAYCAGEIRDGDTLWRLGYDGLQWQIAIPYAQRKSGEWKGNYEVDGDRRYAGGIADNGWTFMWLDIGDLDRIRQGKQFVLDVGRASIDHPLRGTAAVITKIEECLERNGRTRSG